MSVTVLTPCNSKVLALFSRNGILKLLFISDLDYIAQKIGKVSQTAPNCARHEFVTRYPTDLSTCSVDEVPERVSGSQSA